MKTTINTLIKNLLIANEGKFFSVTFKKKDGTIRKLNGRLGVHFGKQLQQSTVKSIPKYLTVYDVKGNGYRNVNTNTVIELSMMGKTFKVN
jgi:hypothetical protein